MSTEDKENGVQAVEFAQNVALNFTQVYNGIVELRRATSSTVPELKTSLGPSQGKPVKALGNRENTMTRVTSRGANASKNNISRSRSYHKHSRSRRSRSMDARPSNPNHEQLEAPVHERLIALGNEQQNRLNRLRNALNAQEINGHFEPQINPRSKRMVKRQGSVVDKLLEYESKRNDKLEKQKALLEAREMSHVRPVPSINRRSAALVKQQSRTREGIAERTAQFAKEVKSKNEQLRKSLQEKETAELRTRPHLNQRSAALVKHRSVEDMMEWNASKEAKLEAERERKEIIAEMELDFQPKLSKGSRQMTAQMRRTGSVGDRLYRQRSYSNRITQPHSPTFTVRTRLDSEPIARFASNSGIVSEPNRSSRIRESGMYPRRVATNCRNSRNESRLDAGTRSTTCHSLQPDWTQRVRDWEAQISVKETFNNVPEESKKHPEPNSSYSSKSTSSRRGRSSSVQRHSQPVVVVEQPPMIVPVSQPDWQTKTQRQINRQKQTMSRRRPTSAPVRAPSEISVEDDCLLRDRAESCLSESKVMAQFAGLNLR